MSDIKQGFEKLEVWQVAKRLAVEIYKATEEFPTKEQFGLTSQIRRASISIISNIAEGYGRDGDNELARFLSISNGSCAEVKAQLIIANELDFLKKEDYTALLELTNQVGRMLNSFHKKVKGN